MCKLQTIHGSPGALSWRQLLQTWQILVTQGAAFQQQRAE